MSVLSQFAGGGIKSIQRGAITVSGGQSYATATISAVDPSKTVVNFLGSNTNDNASTSFLRISLSTSTSVRADKVDASGFSSFVSFEVIEFY